MKTIDPDNEINKNSNSCKNTEEVTDLLIDNGKAGQSLLKCNSDLAESYNVLKSTPVKHKDRFYERVLSNNNTSSDTRSQSMPNSLDNKLINSDNATDSCDIKSKLLTTEHESPPNSPLQEAWFKTWPERCDKIRNDNPVTNNHYNNTQLTSSTCDKTVDIANINNKVTLNQALQNISLAYSPVTKQLHLLPLEGNVNKTNVVLLGEKGESQENPEEKLGVVEENPEKKLGHRRTEAGSFSSTISSLSDPSPSGSLLDAEERYSTYSEDAEFKNNKSSLSNFFSRNMFSWKSNGVINNHSGGWKLFSKSSNSSTHGSPQHQNCQGIVASSTALIQHIRPSNLPAKAVEEEQRHREEYKAMLAAAKKKEAQNSVARQKQQKLQLQQEEQLAAATKHFTQVVLPNWEAMHGTRKAKDLWWQGLPSSVRGKVWKLAIGNDLNLTRQLYEICRQRAQNRLNSPEPSHCESDQESSMDVIQLDISRTFPNLCIFQEGGPFSDVLHSLLAAYVCYRPDVGYVQGMSFIAAILILNMDEFDAFTCFANLLNRPLHLAAFTLNQLQMQAYYSAYNEIFNYNLPKLYFHFQKSGLTPDLYLLDWVYTIFAKAMPLDVACRIWDVFLRDGDEFLFRTALGVLLLNQDQLMHMDFLHGAQFLTRLPDDLSADQLFKSIQLVSTNVGKQTFGQIVEKCRNSL